MLLRAAAAHPTTTTHTHTQTGELSSLPLTDLQDACDKRGLPFLPPSTDKDTDTHTHTHSLALLYSWLSMYDTFASSPSLSSSPSSSSYSLSWPGLSSTTSPSFLTQIKQYGNTHTHTHTHTPLPPPPSLLLHMPAFLHRKMKGQVEGYTQRHTHTKMEIKEEKEKKD